MIDNAFFRRAAWAFLLQYNVAALPVDVLAIANAADIHVLTFSQLSARIAKPVPYICARYDDEGFTFYSKGERRFVLCYNEAFPSTVTRWTVMHEIAHVHLKHVTPSSPIFTRVRSFDRSIFEVEADTLTRRVLCPSIVLHDLHAFSASAIAELCGISLEAAIYRARHMKDLEARNRFLSDPMEAQVERQFMPFILRRLNCGVNFETACELAPALAA